MKQVLEGVSGGQTQGNSVGLPGGGVSVLPVYRHCCLAFLSPQNLVIPIQNLDIISTGIKR